MATFEQALKESLDYFNGDELAADVFVNKYAMKDGEGNFIETNPSQMHKRMAKEFARIEKNYKLREEDKYKLSEYGQKREELTEEKIFFLFDKFKYIIPQGSPMAILGNPYVYGSLSNCVVLNSPLDSYGGIFFTDQQLAQVMKRRMGAGIDISSLRPEGAKVSNVASTSTGAVSFMERFSNSTKEVAQGSRRGALMISMNVKHPDAEKFALIKQDLKKVTGANISLLISDEFMNCVKENKEFMQQWPVNSNSPKIVKKVNAKKLWDIIVKCAWNSAEPGIMFEDKHHWYSPSSVYEKYKNLTSNPCSEIMMSGNDSCRLMALNLFGFVSNPFLQQSCFNYDDFYKVVYESQRLMDDLVDLELESIENILKKIDLDPEPDYIKEVERKTWEELYNNGKDGRRTGLGFTALADAIAALGLKYGSDESIQFVKDMMYFKCKAEWDASVDMAIERESFVGFDPKVENTSDFIKMIKKEYFEIYNRMMQYGRRNVSISTVAPTGSCSILSQTSSGLEPIYALSYKRRRKINPNDKNTKVDFIDQSGDSWQEYIVYHPKLLDYIGTKMWEKSNKKIEIENSPYFGATAFDIDWKKRIEIQGIIQNKTTHSISSTINLPQSTTEEEIGKIYMYAWGKGLKGITVYRDGSRSGVLIDNDEDKIAKNEQIFKENHAPKRPKDVEADVLRFINEKEKWIAFVGKINNKPYEIFTGKFDEMILPGYIENGKIRKTKDQTNGSRYDFIYIDKDRKERVLERLNKKFNPEFWNYARYTSAVLRHGMPLNYVLELLNGLDLKNDSLNTWSNGVARALKKYIPDGTKIKSVICEQCNAEDSIVFEEGCKKCVSCGWSKCE